MDLVKKLGIKGELDMKATSIKEKKAGRENSNGKMEVSTKENSLMEYSKDTENTTLLIKIRITKENSEWETWKEEELKYGKMERDMKVTSRMAKKKAKDQWNGPMEQNMLDHGEMISCMEMEFI